MSEWWEDEMVEAIRELVAAGKTMRDDLEVLVEDGERLVAAIERVRKVQAVPEKERSRG